MSDEWDDWKKAWDAGARSLPEIQAQADRQRRRIILGFVGIWAISALLVGSSLVQLVGHPGRGEIFNAIVQVTLVTSLLTLSHVSMWGNWRETNETPDAQLALMERRWMVRRRLTLFVQWGGLVLCLIVAGGSFVFAAEAQPPVGALATEVAVCAGMAVFFQVISIRMRKRIDAALGELGEQRRLLRQSDPGDEPDA